MRSLLPCLIPGVVLLQSVAFAGAEKDLTAEQLDRELAAAGKAVVEKSESARSGDDGSEQKNAKKLRERKESRERLTALIREESRRLVADEMKLGDPEVGYLLGWTRSRLADELLVADAKDEAEALLEHSLAIFHRIATDHPKWKPEVIRGRIWLTATALEKLRPARGPEE